MKKCFKFLVASVLVSLLSIATASAQFGDFKPGKSLGGDSSNVSLQSSYTDLQMKFTTATSNIY